ncbi:MAG: BREX-2 system adenine-specific DNA-methyltransferase PglX, partial [Pseudonocardia sp.]
MPFAERLFRLAIWTNGDDRAAGFVGQITANSFMKREFGKKLVEGYFPSVHLTHVIDTSGAYIPGHGTPTAILVGRNHVGRRGEPVRAVLGVRGEPSQPDDPAKGLVWTSITNQFGEAHSETEWVSTDDLPREQFEAHPWSLSGGGAGPVLEAIGTAPRVMTDLAEGSIGRGVRVGADEAFMRPRRLSRRVADSGRPMRPLLTGESIRDWDARPEELIYCPYLAGASVELPTVLWSWRAVLAARRTFQGDMADADLGWWDYMQYTPSAYAAPLSITFAFVATHNQFVLDRGGKVFNRSAPVIKLSAGAIEDDHLALLGLLNSSAACFWLKQVCHDKGRQGVNEGFKSQEWERFYEFTGTKLQEFPLPAQLPLDLGRELDALAQQLARQEPSAVCERTTPDRAQLDAARTEHTRLRRRMIALQEELDWQVYGSYDLLTDREVAELTAADLDQVPEVNLGERAFEIVLARKQAAGEIETAWFSRHRSTPTAEIPAHWPDWYRAKVQARIDVIENRRDLALIERPECKRRWATESWEKQQERALRTWLLDRLEARPLW